MDEVSLQNGTVLRKQVTSLGYIVTLTKGKWIRSFVLSFEEAEAIARLLRSDAQDT